MPDPSRCIYHPGWGITLCLTFLLLVPPIVAASVTTGPPVFDPYGCDDIDRYVEEVYWGAIETDEDRAVIEAATAADDLFALSPDQQCEAAGAIERWAENLQHTPTWDVPPAARAVHEATIDVLFLMSELLYTLAAGAGPTDLLPHLDEFDEKRVAMNAGWDEGERLCGEAWTALSLDPAAATPTVTPIDAPPPVSSSPVTWEQFNVTFDIRLDGTVHVTERQLVRFDGSYTFDSASMEIPLNRLDSIENVAVTIDGLPARYVDPSTFNAEEAHTYTSWVSEDLVTIKSSFPGTSYGDTRDIVTEYDVIGAIRVYDDLDPPHQRFWWIAISADTSSTAPIESSTVSVILPVEVPADQIVAEPPDFMVYGRTYVWTRKNIPAGDDFVVRLDLPPITSATVPLWQAEEDRELQIEEATPGATSEEESPASAAPARVHDDPRQWP
jgi:hypothetical protein